MRVKLPEFETDAELIQYLKDNKADLIKQKCSMDIYSDVFSSASPVLNQAKPTKSSKQSGKESTKANGEEDEVTELRVKVVANTAMWLDHDMDILLPDAAKKSIEERKPLIPHIKDHVHHSDSKIGDVSDILLQELSYAELGIKGDGSTQAIVFITDVVKSYDEKIFAQYKRGAVNQHSIGLRYLQIDLAINDPDSEEFAVWEKYFGQIINPEMAVKRGFFWAVSEIILIENSVVLLASNEITPTLATESKGDQPESSTGNDQPEPSTEQKPKNKFLKGLI